MVSGSLRVDGNFELSSRFGDASENIPWLNAAYPLANSAAP